MWPFKKQGVRSKGKRRVKTFSAADFNRLTSSWNRMNTSIDRDLQLQLPYLRARSRDLCANNEYARRFLHQCRTNIVGATGITLQNRATDGDGTLDTIANAVIESHFKKWSMRGNCDVTGRLSRADIERLIVETTARDGEILFRKIPGYKNAHGWALQLVEADYLDHKLNKENPDGTSIRMGVGLDKWGRAVNYYLLKKHPGDMRGRQAAGRQTRDHEIVPASEIVHLFVPLRPHQTRGVPWMHAAMVSLYDLGGYREAAIVASRVGAAKMGFFVSQDGESYAGDDVDSAGNTITDAEPGTFDQLADGTSLESWNPTYPHEQFESFNKAMLRGMAGGLGVAYHTFASDLEGVNFSSARAGVLEERDMWMVLQQWLIEGFNANIYPEWLAHQLLSRQITFPTGAPLPFSKYDKFNAATWQARRWSWVDPLKDIKANREAIDARVRSISSVIRETGADPDDVFLEIKTEREKLEEMGISPDSVAANPEPPPPDDNGDKGADLEKVVVRLDRLSDRLDSREGTDKIVKQVKELKEKPVERADSVVVNVPKQDPPVVNVQNDIHVPDQKAPIVNVDNQIDVPTQPVPDVKVDVSNNVETPNVTIENNVEVPEGKRKVTFQRDKEGNIIKADIKDG